MNLLFFGVFFLLNCFKGCNVFILVDDFFLFFVICCFLVVILNNIGLIK